MSYERDQTRPVQPPADWPQQPPGTKRPRRRRRRLRWAGGTLFSIIVLAILLLIGDRIGNAVAENEMANQFTANGFPVKPSVTIEGFPFLTQLAVRDLRKIDISAASFPAGPVTITSLKATLTGMHLNSSFNGATIDHVTATVFVSFGALAAAGELGGTGITMTPAGPDIVKLTADVGGLLKDTEEARITQTGPQTISVQVLNSGSALSSALSAFGAFSFSLPQGVPGSLRITRLTLNSQGLAISAAATDATFSKGK